MPKAVRFMKESLKARSVAIVYVNNDLRKGGRDVMLKALEAAGIKVAADISTEAGQVDFSAPALKAKQSGADVLTRTRKNRRAP